MHGSTIRGSARPRTRRRRSPPAGWASAPCRRPAPPACPGPAPRPARRRPRASAPRRRPAPPACARPRPWPRRTRAGRARRCTSPPACRRWPASAPAASRPCAAGGAPPPAAGRRTGPARASAGTSRTRSATAASRPAGARQGPPTRRCQAIAPTTRRTGVARPLRGGSARSSHAAISSTAHAATSSFRPGSCRARCASVHIPSSAPIPDDHAPPSETPRSGGNRRPIRTQTGCQTALGIIDHLSEMAPGGGTGQDDSGDRGSGGDGTMVAATRTRGGDQ